MGDTYCMLFLHPLEHNASDAVVCGGMAVLRGGIAILQNTQQDSDERLFVNWTRGGRVAGTDTYESVRKSSERGALALGHVRGQDTQAGGVVEDVQPGVPMRNRRAQVGVVVTATNKL